MSSAINNRRNKHVILNQAKLKKAQQVLGAKTETEAIERALDSVIGEAARNRQAWSAHEKFIKAAVRDHLVIEDVFGRLEGK
jgi:hypothetical protein